MSRSFNRTNSVYNSDCGGGAFNASDNHFAGNTVTLTTTRQYDGIIGVLQPVTGSSFSGDIYHVPSCTATSWDWATSSGEVYVGFADWQSLYGQDTDGGCS